MNANLSLGEGEAVTPFLSLSHGEKWPAPSFTTFIFPVAAHHYAFQDWVMSEPWKERERGRGRLFYPNSHTRIDRLLNTTRDLLVIPSSVCAPPKWDNHRAGCSTSTTKCVEFYIWHCDIIKDSCGMYWVFQGCHDSSDRWTSFHEVCKWFHLRAVMVFQQSIWLISVALDLRRNLYE